MRAPTDPTGFVKHWAPTAQQVNAALGIPASVALAQAALESGWGTSAAAQLAHNYFGMTATGSAAQDPYWRGETYGQYRAYNTGSLSFWDYARNYWTYPGYAAALAKRADPTAFIQLAAPIYSPTDTAYAQTVLRLISEYDLTQYDVPPSAQNLIVPASATGTP